MLLTCILSLSRDQEMQPKRQDRVSLPSPWIGLCGCSSLKDLCEISENKLVLIARGGYFGFSQFDDSLLPLKSMGTQVRLNSMLHFRNLMWSGNYMQHNCLQSCQHMQGWTVGLDFLFFLM